MILRIHTSKDSEQAKRYYVQKSSVEAYYSENQEFSGYWGGAAASHFGLKNRVDEEGFTRLCDKLHPVTGKRLTARIRENGRAGEDINWNFPKSVSLVFAYTKDERILQACRQAVRDTMEEMEKLVSTRVRKNGVKEGTRITGNWVYGEFVHLTARPVDGIPDPHLHIHCFVPNVTFDPVEKVWKAAETRKIHDNADNFNAAVTRRLMSNLKDLGLPIEMTENGFEIAGISREIVEAFSRRTKEINEEAERRGITDPKVKAGLAAITRERKVKTLLIPELEEHWWGGLAPETRKAFEGIKALLDRTREEQMARQLVAGTVEGKPAAVLKPGETSKTFGTRKELAAANGNIEKRESVNKRTRPHEPVVRDVEPCTDDRRAVKAAALHLFERASVVTELQLMGEAARNWNFGNATWDGIKKVVQETAFIRKEIDGEIHLTTDAIRAEEKQVIQRCRDGVLQFAPMNKSWKIMDKKLNKGQQAGVLHVVNSLDRVIMIEGDAGTGKTTLLHEAKRAIEGGFNRLLVFAPTSEAARDVLRGEGFHNAETVARLLVNEVYQEQARDAVWWIDEAGLLSVRQMNELLALAEKLGSRIVLVGDPKQHHSVERGQGFNLLAKHGLVTVAHVSEIMRQRWEYKRFSEQLVAKDYEAAFESLETMESLHEVPIAEMAKFAAEKYLRALKLGQTVQATCPTHKECDQVTEAIREVLKREKILKNGVEWKVLKNERWTKAEKQDHRRYKRGQVVQINRHVKGFSLGEQLEVVGVRDGVVRVKSKTRTHERIRGLNLAEANSFGVYQPETIEICEGETIRITCNGRNAEGHRLYNGTEHKVDYISHDGKIVLKNGWLIDKSFKHINYSYSPTGHSIQGKTVDRVIVVQLADSPGADAKQFYVSTTRGRKGLDVVTNSKEILFETVSKNREKMMATEMEAADNEPEIAVEPAGSSDELGKQMKSREIKMQSAMKEKVRELEAEISELLGKIETEKLAPEAAKQLEHIKLEKEAKELERDDDLAMGM